jgi:ABC-type amino acid transport substrate-binding protein
LTLGSPIRKSINAALLKMLVDGKAGKLETTWFEEPAEE